MLLSLYSNPKPYFQILELMRARLSSQASSYFQIMINADEDNPPITGTFFELNGQTALAFDTYNMILSEKYAKSIDKEFGVHRISDNEFKKIFERSYQVVECEYIFRDIERKATAFDLKGLEALTKRLRDSVITALTFSLKDFKVIITAREEGRISISPDVPADELVKILRLLLGTNLETVMH